VVVRPGYQNEKKTRVKKKFREQVEGDSQWKI
jgi:hypothetical protein